MSQPHVTNCHIGIREGALEMERHQGVPFPENCLFQEQQVPWVRNDSRSVPSSPSPTGSPWKSLPDHGVALASCRPFPHSLQDALG